MMNKLRSSPILAIPDIIRSPPSQECVMAYILDLVLRNNRTSVEHPAGIFHPHADVHHIKKENIGLIEVMDLAVLPARLKNELVEIVKFLLF